MSLPAAAERKQLLRVLTDLSNAVEDLLLSGLAAASESTRETVRISAQAASRMRLLRLGSTLRVIAEELGRYAANDAGFSRRRYSFFLNRAWMLARGMRNALTEGDAEQWQKLTWNPGGKPVKTLKVVTLGVNKRIVPNAFCAFEFRLRTVRKAGKIAAGSKLLWTCVFPMKAGSEIPAEALLHLPQKQKFTGHEFLAGKVMTLRNIHVSEQGRVTFGEDSEVESGEAFEDWPRFANWDPAAALARLAEHATSPFDLAIELQEEVLLTQWQAGEPEDRGRDGGVEVPVAGDGLSFVALVSPETHGELLNELKAWSKPKRERPPLFGTMHYEGCRLVLQPLSVLTESKPEMLELSKKNIDQKELLKGLTF